MRVKAQDRTQLATRRSHTREQSRHGIATIWLVGFGPALLMLLVLVTEIASLWLARIELETAVESGALASVTVWGGFTDDTTDNRITADSAAHSFAEANTVLGETFTLAPDSVKFGTYDGGQFTPGAPGTVSPNTRACVVHATVQVEGLWNGLGSPRSIQASATAHFDTTIGAPRLVRVATVSP